jgi:hypothetical protein
VPDEQSTKGRSSDMIAIDILEWPGMNQAFLASLIAATVLTLVAIPYGKRRPLGQEDLVGRGDARRRRTASA